MLPRYPTAQAMAAMLRQGKRPDGTVIAVMPFDSLKNISDTDIAALHLYLKSLPPKPSGGR